MGTRDDKVKSLKDAIIQARTRLGLPTKGKISIDELVQALREEPPVEDLTKFVKHLLLKDQSASMPANLPRTAETRPKPLFDPKKKPGR